MLLSYTTKLDRHTALDGEFFFDMAIEKAKQCGKFLIKDMKTELFMSISFKKKYRGKITMTKKHMCSSLSINVPYITRK